jgi:hypothetical protein
MLLRQGHNQKESADGLPLTEDDFPGTNAVSTLKNHMESPSMKIGRELVEIGGFAEDSLQALEQETMVEFGRLAPAIALKLPEQGQENKAKARFKSAAGHQVFGRFRISLGEMDSPNPHRSNTGRPANGDSLFHGRTKPFGGKVSPGNCLLDGLLQIPGGFSDPESVTGEALQAGNKIPLFRQRFLSGILAAEFCVLAQIPGEKADGKE